MIDEELAWAVSCLERGIVEIRDDSTPSQVGPDEEDLRRVILVLRRTAESEESLKRILKRNRAYVSELHDAINANSMSRLVALKRGGLGRQRKARENEWHVLK